jgi:hypothetical protein
VPLMSLRREGRHINDRMHAIGKPAPAPEFEPRASLGLRYNGAAVAVTKLGHRVGKGLNAGAPPIGEPLTYRWDCFGRLGLLHAVQGRLSQ